MHQFRLLLAQALAPLLLLVLLPALPAAGLPSSAVSCRCLLS
jgi:hypothetical protein